MREIEALVPILRKWVIKAENDFTNAVHTLKLGKNTPTDTVCFHAQQCVEEYLKAVLVLRSISFPKTHDLNVLMALVPADSRPELDSHNQDKLTEYATVGRYPDESTDPTLVEARKAVAIARRVRREVRRLFPRAALRRKSK